MYVGSTDAQRPERFVVLERADAAAALLDFVHEHDCHNFILDGQLCEVSLWTQPEYESVFAKADTVHVAHVDFANNQAIAVLQASRRLEFKHCRFLGKQALDWRQFSRLQTLFVPYNRHFEHLFAHPLLHTLFVDNFNQADFIFPANSSLRTLSITRSKPCAWHSLSGFSALEALYLSDIPSLTDLSWLPQLPALQEIELHHCKNTLQLLPTLAQLPKLQHLWLSRMGALESLKPLQALNELRELTIESGGKLADRDVAFLKQMPCLQDYSIEMANFAYSPACID
ncbi:hypothetical protein LVJ82_00295 [Vitreoscilla massiliensis]|uniref:Leucine-rich repeat domain-containing protein n=1 Tax=Vitreoscilla massiliensis TaxID=1689272 RepID=A0ABY4E125_9NEIS|nr:hypothetical protein [Vitreoscilla massiliensis]UOO89455.1 hypothetical protein LVJ82_00295 [Vitreoscilla massiliensis]